MLPRESRGQKHSFSRRGHKHKCFLSQIRITPSWHSSLTMGSEKSHDWEPVGLKTLDSSFQKGASPLGTGKHPQLQPGSPIQRTRLLQCSHFKFVAEKNLW